MEQTRVRKMLLILTAILLLSSAGIITITMRSYPSSEVVEEEVLDDIVIASPVATVSATPFPQQVAGQQVIQVKTVFDGDTIETVDGNKIRLIGIDTPETVDPRRPVGCFGKEASNFTKSLLQGQMVRLEKDVSETDKYSRLLRYVFLQTPQGEVFVNDTLARQGFAQAKTYPPDVKYQQQFIEAQQEAQAQNRGLWNACK